MFCNMADVVRCGATTASYDINKTFTGKILDDMCRMIRCFIVFSKGVWQTRIRVTADVTCCYLRQFGNIRAHLFTAEGAIEAYGEWFYVHYGDVECLQRL